VVDLNSWSSFVYHEAIKERHNETDNSSDKASLMTARELTGYKLDLVCVQEVRWDKRGNVRVGD
jgi:mRNA deadenylase 3'-5' endonuclease subunit Ccr4